jgi:hypothetical protein
MEVFELEQELTYILLKISKEFQNVGGSFSTNPKFKPKV